MTKREFAVLAVRLLALYVVATSFNALNTLSWVFMSARGTSVWQAWALGLVPFTLRAACGWFLWMYAVPFSRFLVESEGCHQPISSWRPHQVSRLGIALIGLLSLLEAVHLTGQTTSQLALAWGSRGAISYGWPTLIAAVGILPGLIGLVLLTGSRFLSYWLAPHREFSQPQEIHAHAEE